MKKVTKNKLTPKTEKQILKPKCPICDTDRDVILHGSKWFCHRTHRLD